MAMNVYFCMEITRMKNILGTSDPTIQKFGMIIGNKTQIVENVWNWIILDPLNRMVKVCSKKCLNLGKGICRFRNSLRIGSLRAQVSLTLCRFIIFILSCVLCANLCKIKNPALFWAHYCVRNRSGTTFLFLFVIEKTESQTGRQNQFHLVMIFITGNSIDVSILSSISDPHWFTIRVMPWHSVACRCRVLVISRHNGIPVMTCRMWNHSCSLH